MILFDFFFGDIFGLSTPSVAFDGRPRVSIAAASPTTRGLSLALVSLIEKAKEKKQTDRFFHLFFLFCFFLHFIRTPPYTQVVRPIPFVTRVAKRGPIHSIYFSNASGSVRFLTCFRTATMALNCIWFVFFFCKIIIPAYVVVLSSYIYLCCVTYTATRPTGIIERTGESEDPCISCMLVL